MMRHWCLTRATVVAFRSPYPLRARGLGRTRSKRRLSFLAIELRGSDGKVRRFSASAALAWLRLARPGNFPSDPFSGASAKSMRPLPNPGYGAATRCRADGPTYSGAHGEAMNPCQKLATFMARVVGAAVALIGAGQLVYDVVFWVG